MAELTEDEFAVANERGRVLGETEQLACAASYERTTGLLMIELVSGATYSFPARQLQGLERASDEAIAAVEIGSGYGLHWDDLDIDFTVGGLLAGHFGNARHMEALRRRVRHAA